MEWHFVYTFEKWFFKRLNIEFFSSLVSKFHFIGSRTCFSSAGLNGKTHSSQTITNYTRSMFVSIGI